MYAEKNEKGDVYNVLVCIFFNCFNSLLQIIFPYTDEIIRDPKWDTLDSLGYCKAGDCLIKYTY